MPPLSASTNPTALQVPPPWEMNGTTAVNSLATNILPGRSQNDNCKLHACCRSFFLSGSSVSKPVTGHKCTTSSRMRYQEKLNKATASLALVELQLCLLPLGFSRPLHPKPSFSILKQTDLGAKSPCTRRCLHLQHHVHKRVTYPTARLCLQDQSHNLPRPIEP